MDSINKQAKEALEKHDKRYSVGRRKYDVNNVVRLASVPCPPQPETVTLLKELLRLAEQGRVTGLVYVARLNGGTVKGVTGLGGGCRNTIRGAVLALANEI